MSRNTNISELLFPVNCEPVFLENQNKPIPGFKAISATIPQKGEVTFSVVSNNYELITNDQALEMGRVIHKKLFPNAASENFEIFNVIAPLTKGSCHIDIIDKNYTLNVWAQEVYVPFVRIQNSYNRTLPLKFQIGFCRKLCDNGVIFEENLVTISRAHTRHSLRNLDWMNIDVSHLKKFEEDFIKKTKKSVDIELPRKYFLPLAAKVLNLNFDLDEKNEKKRKLTEQKLNDFKFAIENYTDKYIHTELFGENVYSFFNVITDYASNEMHIQARTKHQMQVKCGAWLNTIGEEVSDPKFSWDGAVEKHKYLITHANKQTTELLEGY